MLVQFLGLPWSTTLNLLNRFKTFPQLFYLKLLSYLSPQVFDKGLRSI